MYGVPVFSYCNWRYILYSTQPLYQEIVVRRRAFVMDVQLERSVAHTLIRVTNTMAAGVLSKRAATCGARCVINVLQLGSRSSLGSAPASPQVNTEAHHDLY
jgi:hypothetical protein